MEALEWAHETRGGIGMGQRRAASPAPAVLLPAKATIHHFSASCPHLRARSTRPGGHLPVATRAVPPRRLHAHIVVHIHVPAQCKSYSVHGRSVAERSGRPSKLLRC